MVKTWRVLLAASQLRVEALPSLTHFYPSRCERTRMCVRLGPEITCVHPSVSGYG